MPDTEPAVLSRIEGPVGVLTLNRPQRFNCISNALADGMAEAMDRFEADPSVRVVLVNANGKNFCTGADLDEMLEARQDRDRLEAFLAKGHRLLGRMEASRLPVVAAVQGLCLAGGLEIAMACDVVLAAASARLGDQHAQYGLLPGWGGTQRLPRLVGLRRALELMFSARWLDAEEARAWGLVNVVVPDGELESRAMDYARMLAGRNPEGLAGMKALARAGLDETLDQGLARELALVADGLRSDNVSEGLAAFQARRAPSFR